MQHNVLIIGCGGIGLRHFQSCLRLPKSGYRLIIVDPSDSAKIKAKELVAKSADYPEITWCSSVKNIASSISVAIIATTSNVRAEVTTELLNSCNVGSIIFEKILFDRLSDYNVISKILSSKNVDAYVNCPVRTMQPFLKLKHLFSSTHVDKIKVHAPGDDFGCNAIHYIDLASFIFESTEISFDYLEIQTTSESKRKSFLKISASAEIEFSHGRSLQIFSPEGPYNGIKFEFFKKGHRSNLVCWKNGALKLSGDNVCKHETFQIPKQSESTASLVSALVAKEEIGLTRYSGSVSLHLPLLQTIMSQLMTENIITHGDKCPIT